MTDIEIAIVTVDSEHQVQVINGHKRPLLDVPGFRCASLLSDNYISPFALTQPFGYSRRGGHVIDVGQLVGANPYDYISDVINKIACNWPASDIDALLSRQWQEARQLAEEQAAGDAAAVG